MLLLRQLILKSLLTFRHSTLISLGVHDLRVQLT